MLGIDRGGAGNGERCDAGEKNFFMRTSIGKVA